MELNWISTFILFGVLQSILVLVIFFKKDRYAQNKLFVWAIVVLLLLQLESFLIRMGQFKYFVHILNTSRPFIFLLGPLLLAYTLNGIHKMVQNKMLLLHLTPFILYFIYSLNFYLQPYGLKYNIIASNFHPGAATLSYQQLFEADPLNIQGYIVVEAISLHLLLYSAFALFLLYRERKADNKVISVDKYRWLLFISCMLCIGAFVLFFSQGGVVNGKVFIESPFPNYSADLFSTVAIYSFMAYLLIFPNTLRSPGKKYKTSSLPDSYKKNKLEKLIALIEKEQLFLNHSFSLKLLSEKSGLSPHHISQILNEEHNKTFFELSNYYRITEAKKRLRDTDDFIKIEQLAYDLGYKSKSTFFSAFKKATGLTPQGYRDNLN